ncbi:MAG TPA: hypothetical protein VEB40_07855 [Flavipsychrobacter sp.]|nr:hypothetical protein [Flavipsychrobacter sp.]
MAKALNAAYMTVTKEKVKALWNHLLATNAKLAASLYLYGAEHFWEVETHAVVTGTQAATVTLAAYEKFSAITTQTLEDLRHLYAVPVDDKLLFHWLEKMLRFAEINMNSFESKIPAGQDREVFTWLLISLFLDEYYRVKDVRFLNAAMKLFDKKWLRTNSILADNAGSDAMQGYAVRNYMLIEYAIHNLRNV